MVSIIIATFNRPESLKKCLASLLREDGSSDAEILIIDSGRYDNSAEFLRHKRVKYFFYKGSLAAARQFGFEKAKGEILIYIDDDCEVTKDWLKSVLEPFKDKNVGGVSGPTIVPKSRLVNRDVFLFQNQKSKIKNQKYKSKIKKFFGGVIGGFYNKVILEGREKEVGKIVSGGWWTMGSNFYKVPSSKLQAPKLSDVDYLEACNMAIRKELIERAGGFDLNFKGTSEWSEVDLAFRIRKLGYKMVFNPKAVVYHYVSREGAYLKRAAGLERLRNFVRFYFKNHDYISGGILKYFRFFLTVLFMEGYFLYKTIKARDIRWMLQ